MTKKTLQQYDITNLTACKKRGWTIRNNLKGRKSAKNTMKRFAEWMFFPD